MRSKEWYGGTDRKTYIQRDEDNVLGLHGCGPRDYPGMPGVVNMPLPKKLFERGVRDLVRMRGARMGDTAYGTVVFHVAPESAAGGPLTLLRGGDIVVRVLPARRLDVDVPAAAWVARTPSTIAAAYAASMWLGPTLCRTRTAGGRDRMQRLGGGA